MEKGIIQRVAEERTAGAAAAPPPPSSAIPHLSRPGSSYTRAAINPFAPPTRAGGRPDAPLPPPTASAGLPPRAPAAAAADGAGSGLRSSLRSSGSFRRILATRGSESSLDSATSDPLAMEDVGVGGVTPSLGGLRL